MTRVQEGDFSTDEEISRCVGDRKDVGGVAVFTGIARDVSGGKKVLKIEFSQYEDMAARELARVREKAMAKFDIIDLSIVHRVGTVRPGERIVAVVAAAMHRTPAFGACSFAIDELKATVPIWKKEFFTDGSAWVGDLP